MIIGLGTGRCGTTSLANWLGLFHEFRHPDDTYMYPDSGWTEKKIAKWEKHLNFMADKFNIGAGDVSFSHINLLDYWVTRDDVDLILLVRDREATVRSLWNFHNHLSWELTFPWFDLSTIDGYYEYYDWYHDECFKHEDKLTIIEPEQIPIIINKGKA